MQDRDVFDNWVGQWEKAMEDGIFKNPPEKEDIRINNEEPSKETFFGDLNINTNSTPSQEEVQYWNDVSNYSEDVVLNESKEKEEKTKVKNLVKKVANNANPVMIDSLGKDNKKPSKKGFATNEALGKIEELKNKLYSLENEILTKETLGKDYKKAEKEMEKVYSIIDKLSDELNQGKFEVDQD